jgi:hypothetical protein
MGSWSRGFWLEHPSKIRGPSYDWAATRLCDDTAVDPRAVPIAGSWRSRSLPLGEGSSIGQMKGRLPIMRPSKYWNSGTQNDSWIPKFQAPIQSTRCIGLFGDYLRFRSKTSRSVSRTCSHCGAAASKSTSAQRTFSDGIRDDSEAVGQTGK